jgi:hypothetical protein
MRLSNILTVITGWLRVGYPEQAPRRGYMPLLALTPTRLGDADVDATADELVRAGKPVSLDAIRATIAARSQSRPLDSDIARVSARLVISNEPSASEKTSDQGSRRRRLHRAG